MAQKRTTKTRLAGFKEALVRPTIRLIVALAVLFFIRFLLIRIPGSDLVLVEPDISVALLVYGVVTLVMMAAVLNYASDIGAILRREMHGPAELTRVVQLVGVIVVLVWAYPNFQWLPYFDANPGQYDLLFLVLGLVFGGWLGFLLYTNVDEFSALVAQEITEDRSAETTGVDAEPEAPVASDRTPGRDDA